MHVFLDTNLLLHFRRPDQINWREIVGGAKITIVIAPVVLRELEEQKIRNASRQLRDRASNVIKWLDQLIELEPNTEIRPGVTLLFISHEPEINFADHHLSHHIGDDTLIASAIELGQSTPGPVLVATADIGVRLKLRAHGIRAVSVSGEYRLESEPDPSETELRRLRLEVAQLKARTPELRAIFENDEDHYALRRRSPKVIDIALELQKIITKYGTPVTHRSFHGVDPRMIRDAISKELDGYYSEYKAYLQKKAEWEKEINLRYKLLFALCNDGTAMASNVDVILTFPDDTRLEEAKHLPKAPKEPSPPGRWSGQGIDPSIFALPQFNINYDGEPFIENNGNRVRFPLSTLKHGFIRKFKPLFLAFQDNDSVRSHTIEVEISAAELPKPITQQLHIIVEPDPLVE